MLTNTCKEYHSKAITECGSKGVNGSLSEIHILLHHRESDTENCAVGGDERKEDSESLIKRRTDLLEHNLNHLYKSGNHKDERYGLQVGKFQWYKHILVQKEGHDSSQGDDEAYGSGHTGSGRELVGYTEERTASKEL